MIFFFFLTGTKLLHDWHVPKKRNHNLHRRTISSLQPQTAAAWLWRSSRPHCYMCLWFGCGVCVSASVHRLAHVNRRRRDSSALYWRRPVPVLDLCPEVSQWVYEHSCGGRKVTSEKMIFFSSAVSQSWFSTYIVSVCVLQFRKERGEEGLS